jgi:hypothetical protein
MKVLTCPGCGRVKTVPRGQKACSQRCSHRLQKTADPNRYHALKQKAGFARGARARDLSVAHWSKKFPGLPVETVRAIFNAGFSAGDKTGHKRGFRQGQEAAISVRRTA